MYLYADNCRFITSAGLWGYYPSSDGRLSVLRYFHIRRPPPSEAYLPIKIQNLPESRLVVEMWKCGNVEISWHFTAQKKAPPIPKTPDFSYILKGYFLLEKAAKPRAKAPKRTA